MQELNDIVSDYKKKAHKAVMDYVMQQLRAMGAEFIKESGRKYEDIRFWYKQIPFELIMHQNSNTGQYEEMTMMIIDRIFPNQVAHHNFNRLNLLQRSADYIIQELMKYPEHEEFLQRRKKEFDILKLKEQNPDFDQFGLFHEGKLITNFKEYEGNF